MGNTVNHEYDDIINLPHHVSKTRIPMSMDSRAAQFSPFAALTGHKDALDDSSDYFELEMSVLNENSDFFSNPPSFGMQQ